ncbi:3-hydroxyacyl-CoA dehydrogenase family protein [Pseudoflavonifractor phocaeensis]|uniref:3-hydroxyacyl-CoA dehydrogenase family protein n=1 Tax=Pseudoflavonifractor phocaeensis TaxID=1870988 RepID=UPI001F17B678|nr:3-hydroxyacyl-CoA dehydrogenase family protein [Pseudoflavonifractor phocaeensis]MCF2660555.1 3-hydroxyacyl-CoA dehydrogenase family protein [Pseudoflavonifractor phocaeensis]
MKIEDIKTVLVVGAGAMGQQIAMNTALNGRAHDYKVILCDSFPAALEKAKKWAPEYLAGRVAKGRITQEEADKVAANLVFSDNVEEAAAQADLVIEAIIENLDAKRDLFQKISKVCKPDTILGTNSSNIVSSKLADVTEHPERLLNMHYFNPALVMQLVEIVRGPHTADETIKTAYAFAENTGKKPIIIQKEIAGFVANRINAAVTREACLLLEKGIASVEDIDTACEKGLNYPMGPFRLMDLTGLDVNYYVRRDRFAESGDPNDAPSPLVIDKVIKGEYGRKTGKGWYDYSDSKK